MYRGWPRCVWREVDKHSTFQIIGLIIVQSGARERTQPPFLQLNWRFSAALCLANLATQGLVFNSYLKKV